MKLTTRVMMRSLRRSRWASRGCSRKVQASRLLQSRALPFGRAMMRRLLVEAVVQPCPACGWPHDPRAMVPPMLPLTVACACCGRAG